MILIAPLKRYHRWLTRGVMALCFSVFFASCQPDEPALEAPEIFLVAIDPTTAVAFEDIIHVTLHYLDEQGDLGEEDPDDPSLRVRDSRLQGDDWYHIPPLTPDGATLSIEGELHVEIPPLFLLGNGDQESTTLSFQLFDRAGNASNTVISETILILDTLQ